eukprot:TRINITY_DN64717_c0_g1_i1.p2 TRINITY_DN64717_c0_g1~~TRINITY_DN64717_c0_g1_i1.p2  ORF type:complete len:114 (+),score=23.48 TRINITY_DN64717_c0_g1_i1:129-470(+)
MNSHFGICFFPFFPLLAPPAAAEAEAAAPAPAAAFAAAAAAAATPSEAAFSPPIATSAASLFCDFSCARASFHLLPFQAWPLSARFFFSKAGMRTTLAERPMALGKAGLPRPI